MVSELQPFVAPDPASPPVPASTADDADPPAVRRRELADFLRSRRARMTPEDAGLIPGRRRRTPGLRREEVAQLAAVGVTWYTWLEQGRPIRASADVVEAIARALRLDATEREHLFRLAEVTPTISSPIDSCLDPQVQVILDGLVPMPATVINSRYDILAWNRPYELLFPSLVDMAPGDRNVLWQVFVTGTCTSLDADVERPRMVATLRGAFSRHLAEPSWVDYVARLAAASPEFAALWERHDVAEPANRLKRFRASDGGVLSLFATGFAVNGAPEARMMVYTPVDTDTSELLGRLTPGAPTRTG
jgi:transcriptional regulator with XRE-family HTH domain